MTTSRGTTPTYTLTFPDNIDFSSASEVIVTFSDVNYNKILEKTTSDITIDSNIISVYLTQEETLLFTTSSVLLQVNWLYDENGTIRRCASNIARIRPVRNLVNEVIE